MPAQGERLPRGGAHRDRPGFRAVPSLRYLDDTPRFARHAYAENGSEREDIGPAGGFMRDGRAETLRTQALLPLLDPAEMANADIATLAARLRSISRDGDFETVCGPQVFATVAATADCAAGALQQFELEDASFHPYSSRYDAFLAGTATLSASELNGLRLFADPAKGNCSACHPHQPRPGGRGPVFTDFSFHALGVPRNAALAANRDPQFFDLGLCGPKRSDLAAERQYCGFFKTPTLRNVARRRAFFHNGRYQTLEAAVRFYLDRDRGPLADGATERYDDLPPALRANIDRSAAPFNRRPSEAPALSESELRDLLAFLRTLDDADQARD